MKEEEDNKEEEKDVYRDKIFDNEYMSTESRDKPSSFNLKHKDKPIDEIIDERIAFDLITEFVERDDRFKGFVTLTETGSMPKINKSDINQIYSLIITNLKQISKIEAFSELTEYFDITPEKFYESLSNTFKTELIIELRNRGYLKPRKPLF